VWCDTSGTPKTISTATDKTQESFYYRARRVSDNENEVVFDFSFSVPSTGTHKFELRSGSSKLLSLTNLSTVTSYSSVKEVLDNVDPTNPADSSWFLLKQSVSNGTAYTIYYIKTNYASSEKITALLTSSDGNVIDTTATDIPVIDDDVTIDINKTIFTLAAEPKGTVDPINPGIFTPSFSKGEKIGKLIIAAMIDRSLAHNSPVQNPYENGGGIFTNYMQFMDVVVRSLGEGIGSLEPEFARLVKILSEIQFINKSIIIDPVDVDNYGVSFEYGKKDILQL
jgi:hypothetical protein